MTDADLGELKFIHGIGWTGITKVGQAQVEIGFYSQGELPTKAQKEAVDYWLKHWPARRDELNAFLEAESRRWRKIDLPADWLAHGIPPIATLELSGIVGHDPAHSGNVTIYLTSPGDEYRQIYIITENERPVSCGFDDA